MTKKQVIKIVKNVVKKKTKEYIPTHINYPYFVVNRTKYSIKEWLDKKK